MRKVIVEEFMSLDGVVQAPGGEDEDTTGGFEHGGWHMRYMDEPAQKRALEGIVEAGGFILGRRTYEIFAAYWPNAPKEEQVIAEPLNTKPKYVASRTLSDPLEWQNSTVLQGDVAQAVAALKREDGADLHIIGSTELVQTLLEHREVRHETVGGRTVPVGSPGSKKTRSPGRMTSTGPPRRCASPTPSRT